MRPRYLALAALTLSFGAASLTAPPARAGCLSGAVVAGCAVGHHHAKVAQQRQHEAAPTAGAPGTGATPDTATH